MEEPLTEITLRRYEKPYQLTKRELLKKICLSLGLLQPADSRDVVIDILQIMIDAKEKKLLLSSEEIKNQVIEIRKNQNLSLNGIADSNIRRQLKKLRDIFIVEKIENKYRINEFEQLEKIFESKIEKFLLPQITERIKEYLKEL
ncbi:hypothetical protein COS75_00555 [Candidatus Pacearchaeota archaeon CG06_land_8_20_14_3_00_35_12]|nr:MAG: hypothetical protein COS75_00555 [Candidatus Pacearchaeota archaeon CG06_land_8_20_14_3_00_35_12]